MVSTTLERESQFIYHSNPKCQEGREQRSLGGKVLSKVVSGTFLEDNEKSEGASKTMIRESSRQRRRHVQEIRGRDSLVV